MKNLIQNSLEVAGQFSFELLKKDGSIQKIEALNAVTNVGKNGLLDIMFNDGTQLTTWYCGLVNNASFTAFAPTTDTMDSHAGWIEFTGYTEGTREEWTSGAASSQSITNSTAMEFTINATATLKGAFIASNSTKSGTTGTLWSTVAFSNTVAVESGDVFRVTYTLNVS